MSWGSRKAFQSATTLIAPHEIYDPGVGLFGLEIRLAAALFLLLAIGPLLLLTLRHLSRGAVDKVRLLKSFPKLLQVKSNQLLFLALVLLAPSATVITRIEPRWLYGSFVLLILAVCAADIRIQEKPFAIYWPTIWFLATSLGLNLSSMTKFEEYNYFRENTHELLEELNTATNGYSEESFSVVVGTDNFTSYLFWSTNNGLFLKRYGNPEPFEVRVLYPSESRNQIRDYCQEFLPRSCVVVTASAARPGGVAAFDIVSVNNAIEEVTD